MVRASPTPGKIFGALIKEVRFAADSLLEGDGFELSVPREIGFVSRLCRLSADLSCGELRVTPVRRVVPRRIDHRVQFDRILLTTPEPSVARSSPPQRSLDC